MLVHYKKVIPDKISLLPPVKNPLTKKYESSVIYSEDSSDFFIQTPPVNICNNKISFSIIKSPKFLTFLEELRERITSILYKKSSIFFKGKEFTESEILKSLVFYSINDNGIVELNTGLTELNSTGSVLIMNIERIIFDKSKISLEMSVIKAKEKISRPEECIFTEDL